MVAAIDFDARSAGGYVTVIHHLVTEEPRIIFLHFWTNDDALKFARGLRAALDKTASAPDGGDRMDRREVSREELFAMV